MSVGPTHVLLKGAYRDVDTPLSNCGEQSGCLTRGEEGASYQRKCSNQSGGMSFQHLERKNTSASIPPKSATEAD